MWGDRILIRLVGIRTGIENENRGKSVISMDMEFSALNDFSEFHGGGGSGDCARRQCPFIRWWPSQDSKTTIINIEKGTHGTFAIQL